MLTDARAAASECAAAHDCELSEGSVFAIAPTRFDPALVDAAAAVCEERAGREFRITSGALHDAASVSRVMPAAMLFCPSMGGISHALQEDTSEADLVAAIEAFGELAARTLIQ
jgi:N-carbamoyl-L-amino-acid hydrolase